MKQLIVLTAGIVLVAFLVGLIAGPGEDSVLSSVKAIWISEIGQRTVRDGGRP
jgi:hypothetical protein